MSDGPGRPVHIVDIDDHTLVLILQKLQPLDRFNASSVCKRFYNVVQDAKLWIHVSLGEPAQPGHGCDRLPSPYTTLEAAVLASRPGDSILIGPGEHVVEGVSICHPLRLIGSPGCQLLCRRPAAEAGLEIWSNVRLEGLSMVAVRSFCIRHNDGDLHLSRCKLTCHSEHLGHLYSALAAAARQRQGTEAGAGGGLLSRPAGRLTVEETSIIGSMRAVLCQGDGELVDVRVLSSACGHCFWFQVRQDELLTHWKKDGLSRRGPHVSYGGPVAEGQEGDGDGGERRVSQTKRLCVQQSHLRTCRKRISRDAKPLCVGRE